MNANAMLRGKSRTPGLDPMCDADAPAASVPGTRDARRGVATAGEPQGRRGAHREEQHIGLTRTRLVAALWIGALAGCGGGGGGSGADTARFVQPTAGVVVASGAELPEAQVPLLYVLSGDTGATAATVGATAGGTGILPAVTGVDRESAHPFETVTLTGSGFRTSGSAISVVFRAPGLVPVAVPVISVTPSRLEVVVPPLFQAGESAAGHATLQVVQIGDWGGSTSDPFDGLEVAALPTIEAAVPAGTVLDAYLQAAIHQLDYLIGLQAGSLPQTYWTAVAAQRSALSALDTAVKVVIADPAATPAVPSSGAGTVTLSAAALATADRLVAGMLLQLGPGLDFTTTDTLPALRLPVAAAAQPACPANTTDQWIDDFICKRQRYGFTLADLGAKLVQIGARFEVGFSLGVFGGMVTSGLAGAGSQLELAFELTWSALSGHIAAWATAGSPPTSGETLSDVGVTLLDRLAGTQGVIGAIYSTNGLLRECDQAVREAGTPVTPPPGDNPWAGTWTGTYSLNVTGACTWHHHGGALVNVYGTPGAYTGDFVFGGVQALDEYCALDSTMSIDGDLAAIAPAGTTFNARIPDTDGDIVMRGTLSGGKITGTLSRADAAGTFTLTKQ